MEKKEFDGKVVLVTGSSRGIGTAIAKAFAAEGAKLEAMRKAIEAAFGLVDVLIVNAGGNLTPPAALEEIPEEGWRQTVDANLTASYLTIKSFLPGMKARNSGNIVTMSSAAARMPNAYSPIAYGAAKAGIIVMTQDLAAQVGKFGVRVNCITPSTILTERNLAQIPPETREMILKAHALKQLGKPEDVAEAALFLASERSAWITGVTLDIAGGYVMR